MKLVIIDRDALMHPPAAPHGGVEGSEPLPEALEAVARLNHAGFAVVLTALIPRLGTGHTDMAQVNALHARLHKRLSTVGGRVEAIFFCPHRPDEHCDCRMPKPGLLLQVSERWSSPLVQVPVVSGDAADLVAALAVGCAPHGLHAKGAPRRAALDGAPLPEGVPVHASLGDFVTHWLTQAARPAPSP